MNLTFKHKPVMASEVISFFKKPAHKTFVDATAGGGGHLLLLAEIAGCAGRVLAFDRDERALKDDAAMGIARLFPTTVTLFQKPFSQIKKILAEHGIEKIDGLLCDLGVSSNQLDDISRGFSFMADSKIDMRMDRSSGLSAYEWLAETTEEEIAHTLFSLGGERKSRAIARRIKASWPIENSTLALAKLVQSAIKQRGWSKIHPATRTFQAIRMAVNQEVLELETLLSDLPDLLAPHGVAVFLSFHSIEDRLIKNRFKELAQKDSPSFAILTKKPLTPTPQEIMENRRARSAKLRALMRVS
jgi:16S rRNA (cytosine1402-N4)-methyltransferase